MGARIRICKKCSGISSKDLKGVVSKDEIKTGCFGHCAKKHPELKGMVWVKADGKVLARPTKKKLVKALT